MNKGYYKAISKDTKEEWIVYTLHYNGFPKPKLTGITILLNDYSDYEYKSADTVDIYYCQ